MSLVQKIYGKAIKADEINKIIQEKVYNYIKENKIDMLGEPLPNDAKESGMSLDDDDMKFYFDIALAPEFEVSVDKEDSITYYEIKVSDEMVENRIKDYTRQFGRYEQVDGYADNDMIKGRIVELEADGSVKEGGIEADSVTIMPTYFKEESQKKLFKGAVKGGTVVFSPSKAYNGSEVEISSLLKIKKEEVAGNISDFSLEIESITRFIEADLNQELFDGVFGKDTVKDIDDFRSKVREMIAAGFVPDSDYRFMLDSRTYFMEKVGKLDFADDLLKRIIKANRKEDEQDSVDTDFGRSLEELKWHLIKEKLVEKYAVKVEEDDVKAMAREATRAQFAQYGMMNLPDELLDNYSKDMLKKRETVDGLVNRVVESKLTAALKKDVKLKKKKVSVEEFNKLFENPSVS